MKSVEESRPFINKNMSLTKNGEEKPIETLDEKLAVALQRAIRGPKLGQFEQLLANELAVAAFNVDPLQKIRHILEAYMMLSDEERAKLLPAEEQGKVEVAYRICVSLLNVVEYPLSEFERLQAVPFDFQEKQAEKYLSMVSNSPIEAYRSLIADAHPVYVSQFRVRFICSYMPLALQVMRRILEEYISQETWMQTLQALQRRTLA